jgi:hypothetical protein
MRSLRFLARFRKALASSRLASKTRRRLRVRTVRTSADWQTYDGTGVPVVLVKHAVALGSAACIVGGLSWAAPTTNQEWATPSVDIQTADESQIATASYRNKSRKCAQGNQTRHQPISSASWQGRTLLESEAVRTARQNSDDRRHQFPEIELSPFR